MSKHRPRGRPGGHPANRAAARRAAATRRGDADDFPRRVVREASALTGPLEAELWASSLLGVFWSGRHRLPPDQWEPARAALVFGEPLVEAVARVGGIGARIALSAVACVDGGDLGLRAGELAARLEARGGAVPWLEEIGGAEVVAAAVMREDVFDDGITLFLESRHPSGGVHAVAVYVDNNLGVIAKDIFPADSIERVEAVMRRNPDPDGAILKLEPLEPGAAAGVVHDAIAATDLFFDPPVADDYASCRALALLRADETANVTWPPERPEIEQEERDRLRDAFLASPEASGFARDGDEAFVASLAIDFCAGYTDGRPLRWSPVTVELFMTDFVPSKVVVDDSLLEGLPAALDAWVRFVGREAERPDWAIERTREAIRRWQPQMLELAADPAVGGPGKQLARAVREAGVDLEDDGALRTFIAGWNARSSID